MKAVRIPLFVLAVLLAFSVCNAVYLTRRCLSLIHISEPTRH